MVDALKALGVEAEYHYYGDKKHVLGHVFHCNMKLPEASVCNKDEADFFLRHVK
jgi:dipeptidyl aminopeptidase/acylaminoacyl peptidase